MYRIGQIPTRLKMRSNITGCLIFALIIVTLSSCTVPQTVRYSKTADKGRPVHASVKSPVSENETYRNDEQNDNTDKSIKSFEQLLEQAKSEEINTDDSGDQPAKTGEERIPSLREQMATLQGNQDRIGSDVRELKAEISEIKSSVDEIKTAVYGLNNIVRAENAKPAEKPAPKKVEPVKKEHPKAVKSNVLLSNEKAEVVQNNTPAPPAPKATQESVKNDFTLGEQFYNSRDYNNAVTHLTKVIRRDRNSARAGKAHYYLGKINYEKKNYNQAISHLKRALTVRGNDYKDNSQALLAEAYIRSGNNSLAKEAYRSLIADFPTSKYVPKARKMLQQL